MRLLACYLRQIKAQWVAGLGLSIMLLLVALSSVILSGFVLLAVAAVLMVAALAFDLSGLSAFDNEAILIGLAVLIFPALLGNVWPDISRMFPLPNKSQRLLERVQAKMEDEGVRPVSR